MLFHTPPPIFPV